MGIKQGKGEFGESPNRSKDLPLNLNNRR